MSTTNGHTPGKAVDHTTNDEQPRYGEQPKEREPMLSDGAMDLLYPEGARKGPEHIAPFDELAEAIRDHYEHLITTGKLRVVEEVNSCEDTGCSKCGHYTEDQYGQYSFCPGCGNKIKR